MTILDNAINSIQIGVEDYESDDDRRNTSAVRNISAGILLLYKEKLCRLSPDDDQQLLILKDIRPTLNSDGNLEFKGFPGNSGKTETVNVADIQKRFSSLGVETGWDRFYKINRVRNDLEHFYSTEEPDTIRGLISDSFMLIRDFLKNELGEEPSHLLGKECWSVLLDVNEVYKAEHKVCVDSLNKIDWQFDTVNRAREKLRCPRCQSELVKAENYEGKYPDLNFLCNSCGHKFLFSEVLVQCIHDDLFDDAHIAVTCSGEHPWDDCEECDESAFVLEENACMYCCYKRPYIQCSTEYCTSPVVERYINMCALCLRRFGML